MFKVYFTFLIVLSFGLVPSKVLASQELSRARSLNSAGDYINASILLHSLTENSRYRKEHASIAYETARSFEGLGMKQSAVFQLIKAVRYGRGSLLERALERLSVLAFEVGDDVGLNFALSKINIKRFPKAQKPVLYFRFGEAYLGVNRFKKAIRAFSKVPKNHYLYSKAKYLMGLAYSEDGRLKSSYSAFTQAANSRAESGVVDDERVAALMGRARVLYHMKKWKSSLSAYRMIPRDSKYFHDMMFESAWAMLRAGKFRSAVSNFQSLHSEYYADYFYPEAALLRAIVYLYICKVDEVNKVIQFYENTYEKMYVQLSSYLKRNKSPREDVAQFLKLLEGIESGETVNKKGFKAPYVILRHLNRSSKVKAKSEYYANVEEEIAAVDAMQGWGSSTVGAVAKNSLMVRRKASLKRLGKALREEMIKARNELAAFGDQKELIKFELISSEKEQARKKLEGRDDFSEGIQGSRSSRFSFTKNGYEYWPFQGEYWLDEIGNYHYLGASRCE